MRRNLLQLSLALLFAGCQAGPREATSGEARGPEAQVCAAALDARYVADTSLLGREAKRLLVVDKTSADLGRFRERRKEMRLASREVLDDFEAKNRQPVAVSADFGLKTETLTVSEEEARALARAEDRDAASESLREKYPEASGVITLSRVGFNRDMTEALVEVDRGLCGKGCGEGMFVLLAREGGRWKVKDYYGVYMA